jgi:hypothetical protein
MITNEVCVSLSLFDFMSRSTRSKYDFELFCLALLLSLSRIDRVQKHIAIPIYLFHILSPRFQLVNNLNPERSQ